jgi:hypothetical protein
MNATNLVSSFALGSTLSLTAQYAILRSLERQLRRSRLPFSKNSHQLGPNSRWMGTLGRPPGGPQMKYNPPATMHGIDTDTPLYSTVNCKIHQSVSLSKAILPLQFTVSPPYLCHSVLFISSSALSILYTDATNQILASATLCIYTDIRLKHQYHGLVIQSCVASRSVPPICLLRRYFVMLQIPQGRDGDVLPWVIIWSNLRL